VSSVWAGVADGTIPRGIKIGGSTRWDEAEIDGWLDRLLAERDSQDEEAA